MTHHIFLSDGTGNGLDDEYPTNIRILSQLAVMPGQKVHYFEGPGNGKESITRYLLGNLFGADMGYIVDQMIDRLKIEYHPGDKISGFGFSRGAAETRSFGSKIGLLGYQVDFMGCFDTVFAQLPFGPLQQSSFFHDLHVSPAVKFARHIVATKEDRRSFAPNLMNDAENVKQIWVNGNHADIGGGYKERGIADRTLAWMMAEAHHVAGINFKPQVSMQPLNTPHREKRPRLRAKRIPMVLVDGEPSDLKPLFLDLTA